MELRHCYQLICQLGGTPRCQKRIAALLSNKRAGGGRNAPTTQEMHNGKTKGR